jgi:regulator of protease activity HflC (stomatin/prohibitin superfamily)
LRGLLGAFGLLLATGCSPHVVEAGTVGVRVDWGAVQPGAMPEGLYWRTWLRSRVVNVDARLQKKETRATASSRDLQVLTAIIALNYRLDPQHAATIYQSIGDLPEVDRNLIDPVLQEAVKTATARYNAEELITKRPEVKQAINDYVTNVLDASHVVVVDLNIVNFEFAEQYQQAIEAKQVAEQKALAATNDLRRIEVEAKQNEAIALGRANALLIQAKAEAERQQLLRQTITAELVQWEAIQKWDGQMPLVQGEGNSFVDVAAIAAARKPR